MEFMWALGTWKRHIDDRVNKEALWQMLRMYDAGGTLLNGIKSMLTVRPLSK